MPVVASVRNSVAITSSLSDPQHSTATVIIDNGDTVAITVNVSDDARLAAAAPATQVAVRLSVDLGNGMVILPANEPPAELTIRESADDISDSLRFQLAGPSWNPNLRAFGRALSRVETEIGYGPPGGAYFARVFTGYVAEAPYSFSPPILSVLALDGACKHRFKRLKDYAVDADSGRTRLSIFTEMMALASIPVRRADLGRDGGGTVNKPVTPGEAYILEYVRDWLSVLDVEIGFIDDELVVQRFDPNGVVAAELYPGDIERGGLSFTPPATLTANKITAVAIKYQRTLPEGETGDVSVVETIAPYAPITWVLRQNAVGADTPNSDPPPATVVQVVSRITTRNTKRGTLSVRTEQLEETMHALAAARLRLQSDEEVTKINAVYQMSDGTWSLDTRERLQPTRLNVATKQLDDELRVVSKLEKEYHYRFFAKALYEVSGTGLAAEDVPVSPANIPVLEDGEGVTLPYETIGGSQRLMGFFGVHSGLKPDLYTLTEYELDDDGLIAAEVITERYPSKGHPRSKQSDGSFGYGLQDREYTDAASEDATSIVGGVHVYPGLRVTRKTYRAINEDEIETVVTTITDGRPETVRTVSTGTRPSPERVEPETITQELRAVEVDEQRVTMSYEIEDFAHNEYIESREEAEAVAAKELRRLSAMPYTITMPLEGQIHKWKWITLNMPRDGIVNMRLYVREVERNFARFRQTVKADYYPTL